MVNYSGNINRNAFTAYATVPTELERAGDFSRTVVQGPVTVFDPDTKAPFPGQPDPGFPARLDFAWVTAIHPLTESARLNSELSDCHDSAAQHQRAKCSHQPEPHSKAPAFRRANWQTRDNENTQTFGFVDNTSGHGYTIDAGWAWTVAPKVVRDLRFRFNRDRSQTTPFFAGLEDTARLLGIEGPSTKPVTGSAELEFHKPRRPDGRQRRTALEWILVDHG